jgi:hypothetical protein
MYTVRYFIPNNNYPTNTTLLTSNYATARNTGSPIGSADWDPISISGISNYGASTERSATCGTDPGAGSENPLICNNRDSLPVGYTPPGNFCFTK